MRESGGVTPGQLKRAGQIVDDGKPAVICGHGENLPFLLQAACARLRKAAWWVLHVADGTLATAERYHPADP